MASLVNKVLFPMDIKRYIVLSLLTLWTLILIIAVIASIIHQAKYQESPDKINLEFRIRSLEVDLEDADKVIIDQKEQIELLKCIRPDVSIEYYNCE